MWYQQHHALCALVLNYVPLKQIHVYLTLFVCRFSLFYLANISMLNRGCVIFEASLCHVAVGEFQNHTIFSNRVCSLTFEPGHFRRQQFTRRTPAVAPEASNPVICPRRPNLGAQLCLLQIYFLRSLLLRCLPFSWFDFFLTAICVENALQLLVSLYAQQPETVFAAFGGCIILGELKAPII